MNILIIGHGRAGKRHTELVHYLGHTPVLYDPKKYYDFALQADPAEEIEILYLDRNQRGLRGILTKRTFDLAVICTPPDLHLSQAQQCLDAGLHVLIEKPLCSWGKCFSYGGKY